MLSLMEKNYDSDESDPEHEETDPNKKEISEILKKISFWFIFNVYVLKYFEYFNLSLV